MPRLSALIDRASAFALGPWRLVSVLFYAAAVLLLCASLGVIGFRITDQTNHEVEPFDQSAYVAMSQKMEGSWYPWYSDGTRNPLFPWLAAALLQPNAPSFFETGKKLNVILAICGTALVGVFFSRRMGPLAAFNCTALAALAALLPISTFFGAEAIFLVLFLFVCACGMRLLNENPVRLYLLLALLSAAAWLAKSSTTPFLALFAILSFGRLLMNQLFGQSLPWHLLAPAWSARRFAVGLAIFVTVYFALIAPRLVHAHKTWGSAFYSLPSFWFWADDWETCVKKYADCRKVRLAELPVEEQPTMTGYFHRHDIGDAFWRLANGASVRLRQLFHPEGKWQLSVESKGKPRPNSAPTSRPLSHRPWSARPRNGRLCQRERTPETARSNHIARLARLGNVRSLRPGHRMVPANRSRASLYHAALPAANVDPGPGSRTNTDRSQHTIREFALPGVPSCDLCVACLADFRSVGRHPIREDLLRILKTLTTFPRSCGCSHLVYRRLRSPRRTCRRGSRCRPYSRLYNMLFSSYFYIIFMRYICSERMRNS